MIIPTPTPPPSAASLRRLIPPGTTNLLLRRALSSLAAPFSSTSTSSSTSSPDADANAQQQQQQQQRDFGFAQVSPDEHKTKVKEVFTSVAESYDAMNDFMSFFQHRLWKDRFVGTLRPFAGQHHVDVAGGTGDVAFRVLDAIREAERREREDRVHRLDDDDDGAAADVVVDPGRVTVCDINAAMLAEGRRKAEASFGGGAAADGLAWIEADAETLPFDDESFDSYSISFGIRNVTRMDVALREAHRVLRKGGHFCCLEFSEVNSEVLRQMYDLYSMNVIPYVGAAYAGDAASYQYLVESIRRFPNQVRFRFCGIAESRRACPDRSLTPQQRAKSPTLRPHRVNGSAWWQEQFAAAIAAEGFSRVRYENLLDGVVAIHSGFKL